MLAPQRGRRRARRGARGVPLERDLEWHVEHDRDGRTPMASRHGEQLGACPVLDVRGVDDGEPPAAQPHGEDPMEQVEGVVGGALGRRVVGDQRAQRRRTRGPGSGGSDAGEGRLAAAPRSRPGRPARRRGSEARRKRTDRRGRRRSVMRPCECGAARSALGVAVRAHLRVGDRRLRLTDRARQGAAADRQAGLTHEMDLAEVAIRQAPRHIATLACGGRGHEGGLRVRTIFCQKSALFTNRPVDLAA